MAVMEPKHICPYNKLLWGKKGEVRFHISFIIRLPLAKHCIYSFIHAYIWERLYLRASPRGMESMPTQKVWKPRSHLSQNIISSSWCGCSHTVHVLHSMHCQGYILIWDTSSTLISKQDGWPEHKARPLMIYSQFHTTPEQATRLLHRMLTLRKCYLRFWYYNTVSLVKRPWPCVLHV